ncbi:MAG: SRPBCC family protein [Nocardioides sp.]
MSDSRDRVSVQRVIPAPAAEIFALLADPSRHAEIDGSGHVVQSREGSGRVGLGDVFGMDMKRGVGYRMRNTVIAFEPDRTIAWQSLGPAALTWLVTGRTWTYELAPAEGGTLVTETWDISREAAPSRPLVRRFLADETRRNMARTLERLEARFAVN